MKITIDPSEFLNELLDCLHTNDCVTHKVDAGTWHVIHLATHNPEEARVELTFFLRAWQTRHPEAVVLLTG